MGEGEGGVAVRGRRLWGVARPVARPALRVLGSALLAASVVGAEVAIASLLLT